MKSFGLRAILLATLGVTACGEGEIGDDGQGGAGANTDTSSAQGTGATSTGTEGSTGSFGLTTASTGGTDPPTVSAGQDQTLVWPIDRVALHPTTARVETARWEQVSGPSEVVVREVDAAEAVATGLRIGDTVLRITVENDEGESASDEITVHVVPPSITPATPVDWSIALPAPTFRAGHDLPPLTRWTGMHVLELQKRLAARYGYALDLGDTSPGWDEDFANPNGTIAQKIALKKLDPEVYKLSIQVWRPLVDGASDFYATYPEMRLRDANGQPTSAISPEAPDALFEEVAEMSASRLRAIAAAVSSEVPASPQIDVVLNGGEYGLGVWGDDDAKWLDDDAVRAAIEAEYGLAPGATPTSAQMFEYISERKQRQEQIVTDAHTDANPGGFYVYYPTWSAGWRQRWGGWWRFTWDYPIVASLSAPAGVAMSTIYYRDYSSQNTGWGGDKDALSQLTNAQAWQQEQGAPLQYLSTCGGWPHTGSGFGDDVIATDESYMGYLKAAYTVGLVGGIGGYFTNPGWGEEDVTTSDAMPNWLRQLITLGEVHALFSHLESFLRQGTLIAGPDAHRWSTDQPAYELPALTGGADDPGVRVVARRNADGDAWLVTAWAFEGAERDVTVVVDDTLGDVELTARPAGSVYVFATDADGVTTRRLLDVDPMLPTDTLLSSDAF